MSRITLNAARRRLQFRADEIAYAIEHGSDDMFIGHARAAWAIALRLPADIVATLAHDIHAEHDPHCTCNDCMADYIEQVG